MRQAGPPPCSSATRPASYRSSEPSRAGALSHGASPSLRVILLRAGMFMFFANSIWALLPLVARTRLHLGSGGYGLLLGGVGIGAVAGAAVLPRVRTRVSPQVLMTTSTLAFAAVTLSLAYLRTSALAAVALLIGGFAWILALSTLNSLYQSSLPGWAKARGMSYYLVVFQGAGALGSAAFGVLAQSSSLTTSLLTATVGLTLVAVAGLRLPFKPIAPDGLLPAGDWPSPQLLGAE